MLFPGHVVLYLTLFDDDNNRITYSISCVISLYCTCKKFVKKKVHSYQFIFVSMII